MKFLPQQNDITDICATHNTNDINDKHDIYDVYVIDDINMTKVLISIFIKVSYFNVGFGGLSIL